MNTEEAINDAIETIKYYNRMYYDTGHTEDLDKVIELLKRGEKYEAKLSKTLEVLEIAINKLKEYANEDIIANLNGCGCFTDPHKFIKDVVEKANKIIMEEVKNE